MSSFTLAELAREAEREVDMRRQVYRRQVAMGHMTQETAYRKIAIMETIAEKLAAEAEAAGERQLLL